MSKIIGNCRRTRTTASLPLIRDAKRDIQYPGMVGKNIKASRLFSKLSRRTEQISEGNPPWQPDDPFQNLRSAIYSYILLQVSG